MKYKFEILGIFQRRVKVPLNSHQAHLQILLTKFAAKHVVMLAC